MVMSVEVSCDDIVGEVEKLIEQGSIVLVVDVGCVGSGWNVTVGDMKGGFVSSFVTIVSIWLLLFGVVISVKVIE